jgi:hypothetical protein
MMGVFLHVWLIEKKGISPNGIIGYVAPCYVWVFFIPGNSVLAFCIPFFHSLQYMPFVYKFKRSELEQSQGSSVEKSGPAGKALMLLIVFALIGVTLGGLFMNVLPKQLDRIYSPLGDAFSKNFFLISFLMFINIHHFFIDNAFWRRDNTKIQQFLFRA